jgi:hypothetical protein
MIMTCIGVDSSSCGVSRNVDFVNFVWENNNMLCFRRHTLTFLRIPGTGHGDTLDTNGRLLCLRHYRVASEGWAFTSRCSSCSTAFQEGLRHLTGCVASEEPCSCNVCKRQPPTLLDMASRNFFTMTNNVDRFRLTRDVTHSEFVQAVNSRRARVDMDLPPDYPDITVRFRYRECSRFPFHYECDPSLPWHASATTTFTSPEEGISELFSHKDLYWCAGCERPMFFRNTCEIHQAEDVEN